jgi:hypothetical protein
VGGVEARLGERTALVCGAETVSYAEFMSRVRRSAAALRAFGVDQRGAQQARSATPARTCDGCGHERLQAAVGCRSRCAASHRMNGCNRESQRNANWRKKSTQKYALGFLGTDRASQINRARRLPGPISDAPA